MEDLKAVLDAKDGVRQRKLAESIVDNAIEGNAACLSFIAERLAPVVRDEGQGRTVFEGIRLEVVSSSVGASASSRTSIALVRGSESHSESTAQNADDPTGAETPSVIEGVKLDSQESRESQA